MFELVEPGLATAWNQTSTRAASFAQGWGDTRFAPIQTEAATPVHTYYVASTPQAAYMEFVLHDVPLAPAGMFDVASLSNFHLVQLRLPDPLRYVRLHTPYLPRPAAQALGYGSRRDDSARCLMLFRQRLPNPPFEILAEEPMAVGARRAELLALVRSLKLHEV